MISWPSELTLLRKGFSEFEQSSLIIGGRVATSWWPPADINMIWLPLNSSAPTSLPSEHCAGFLQQARAASSRLVTVRPARTRQTSMSHVLRTIILVDARMLQKVLGFRLLKLSG